MKLTAYLADRAAALLCFALAEGLAAGLLWLIGVRAVFIGFVAAVFGVFFAASLAWDYARRSRYYNRLLTLLDTLDEKTLILEIAERPDFLDGKILRDILQQNCKYQNDQLAAMQRQNREYREFLEAWVHEIKTPITSARLAAENEKTPAALRIDDSLRRIDNLVELILYYARSEAPEKDFKVERTTVQALVSASLKSYSKPIIQAGGRVELMGLDLPVPADTKSCAFVIGQVIANAIKYRREDFRLVFTAETRANHTALHIRDNGVGIPAADLPRVFEKRRLPDRQRRTDHRLCRDDGADFDLCGRSDLRRPVRRAGLAALADRRRAARKPGQRRLDLGFQPRACDAGAGGGRTG